MSSLSCLRGSQACLNCLLASKPLICKLAPLILSLSLSVDIPHSLHSQSLTLSLVFALFVRLCLSSCFVCTPLPCPPPSPFLSLLSLPLCFYFISFAPLLHSRSSAASFCQLLRHNAPLHRGRRHPAPSPSLALSLSFALIMSSHTTYATLQLQPHPKKKKKILHKVTDTLTCCIHYEMK